MDRALEGDAPIDDFWPRALGIPCFGVAIPIVFDLYGSLGPSSPIAWLGQVLFLALAFALWQGNRHLLFVTADRFDWLERPWLRVARLALGIVLFTAPLTVAALGAWSHLRGGPALETSAFVGVVLTNVICVVFVAHVYETVLLVKQREADRARVAAAERARVESELLALRRQIDPHFLFNCLNTLGALLAEDPSRAQRFNASLAAMLRYLLDTSERELVSAADELSFVRRYAELCALRFDDGFRLEVETHEGWERRALPPTSVQLLVENALAHNVVSTKSPLVVTVRLDGEGVLVSHARKPREGSRGTGVGLANLEERVRLAYGGRLEVTPSAERFDVRFTSTPRLA
ncbi:MAG: histidine kinase [Deltaproteobacteria bacterium]|nr:histidine kinase [Deltaproteobacteria bacterium]